MPGLNPASTTPDIQHIRAMLIGVLFDCPLGGNPSDCVCHEIRKLTARKRFEWVRLMTDAECIEVFRKHQLCLKRKAGRTDYSQ